MAKERRSKAKAVAANAQIAKKRREIQFKLAVHVAFSAKKNPNVDAKPVSNPFIVSEVYTARTPLETILDDLSNLVCGLLDTEFNDRFNGYSEFDDVYGIKLWNGGNNKKPSSSKKANDTLSALQARLKKIRSITVSKSNNDEQESSWKNYIKNWHRKSPEADSHIKYLDIGIAIYKPAKITKRVRSESQSSSAPSQSGLSTKKKKSTEQQPPPDRLLVHIMKPVHTAKKNSALETPDTTPLTSINIDFTQHTVLDTMSSLGNRGGSSDSTFSDDDSMSSADERTPPSSMKLAYKRHGIIMSFRNEIARAILTNDATKKIYANKLGQSSGLYVTEKSRKAATGITSTKALVDWITKHGKFECSIDDAADADGEVLQIAEIRVAFGVVTENVKDPMQYFEEDFFDSIGNTQLEIDEPADEFDKKKEARKTKTYPAELRVLFMKVYTDEDSPFYNGFTHEMQRAASQYILSYVNTDVMVTFLEEYPPSQAFQEKCRESCVLQKQLKNFQWTKGLYPPMGEKLEPPAEREWKATSVGRAHMTAHPNETGSESALNRLITHITTTSPMQLGGSNAMSVTSVSEGCVRVSNSEKGIFTDVHFGQDGSGFTLQTKLREILRSVRNHAVIDRSTEERVFKVRMKSGEESFYTSEDTKNVTLGFVVSSSGISRGEILHVTTSKRDLQNSFDDISLSP